MDEEAPKKRPRGRRLAVAEGEAWTMPKWFDEIPPPWQQAWSEDDTPLGYQLAQEKAKEVAGPD
jgi:hypothetical protein